MPAQSTPISRESSPSDDSLPAAPPPSLSYTRATLLSLLPPTPPIPNHRRLSSFSPILRRNTLDESHWGVSEDLAEMLDNEPISKIIPIPHSTSLSITSSQIESKVEMRDGKLHPADKPTWRRDSITSSSDSTSSSEVLFQFASPPAPALAIEKRQVLVDFTNPFAPIMEKLKSTTVPVDDKGEDVPSGQNSLKLDGVGPVPNTTSFHNPHLTGEGESRRPSVSSVFQSFPSSVNSSTTSLALPSRPIAIQNQPTNGQTSTTKSHGNDVPIPISSLGKEYNAIRLSRSSSISSTYSTRSSISASSMEGMNPFAPPFRLSSPTLSSNTNTTPTITNTGGIVEASLPLPKPPSSLPVRPPGPLPPVFVKRESAALPQPMALPEIAPLGKDWEGEASLSGNDKRRRASEVGAQSATGNALYGKGETSHARTASSGSSGFSQSLGEKRPERLVRLGQKLRAASISSQGSKESVRA
ncbi:hypothetical protein CI109_107173 [Kwoniella shandongensis]|uniref:Uncharacterized protein n=1 Tax=Kwoniella shandongensis TaxID=1734106 RepID=A0A5M6C6L9_9TREE|nr:uncharacterized protein CI109_002456 [Kwoniella shandongensis]KAA5529115.1 hypothetical protein CI109_002456 [Kwoniella shandongensis]